MWNEYYAYDGALEKADSAPVPTDDPLESIYRNVKQKPQYAGEEQGVFHPVFKQTLKFRNNEMAELFVDKNNGIRMDPHTQSINVLTNHLKQHVMHVTSWITGNETHYIGGNYLENIMGTHVQKVHGAIEIVTDDNRTITVYKDQLVKITGDSKLEVKGNVDAKITGDATIEVSGGMNVKAAKDIKIYAGKDLYLDAGNKIYWG